MLKVILQLYCSGLFIKLVTYQRAYRFREKKVCVNLSRGCNGSIRMWPLPKSAMLQSNGSSGPQWALIVSKFTFKSIILNGPDRPTSIKLGSDYRTEVKLSISGGRPSPAHFPQFVDKGLNDDRTSAWLIGIDACVIQSFDKILGVTYCEAYRAAENGN